ncbi:neurocan core protein-like [Mya arenaria]|uniref:neurocan core protein-like n=1 Tax=Mya arenaria TaxID=6604 RepID=UPI0022E27E79|nr:neurocan core protein-like [Mya arenaria]
MYQTLVIALILLAAGRTIARSACTDSQLIFFQWGTWSDCVANTRSRSCYADHSSETSSCGVTTPTIPPTTTTVTTTLPTTEATTHKRVTESPTACTDSQSIFFQWSAWEECVGGIRRRICYADKNYGHAQCMDTSTSSTTPRHMSGTMNLYTASTYQADRTTTLDPRHGLNCSFTPCQNGGTCNQLKDTYTCTCDMTYTGMHCHKYLFSSYDNSCRPMSNGTGSCYVIFHTKDTWQGAREFCEARQGHLAVTEDQSEAFFLETFLGSMKATYDEDLFWIGGQTLGTGDLQWLPGHSTLITRWPGGRAPAASGTTECLAIDGQLSFQWQPLPCNRPTYFVCEEKSLYSPVLG